LKCIQFNQVMKLSNYSVEELFTLLERKFEGQYRPHISNHDRELFIDMIESYFWESDTHQHKFNNESLLFVFNYLKLSHSYYLETKLPEIQGVIDRISETNPGCSALQLIRFVFDKYVHELSNHIQIEESRFFPLVEKVLQNNKGFSKQTLNHLFSNFYLEHDDTQIELDAIIELCSLYDAKDELSKSILIGQLNYLKKDLEIHHILEEEVLIPNLLTRLYD
jgi:iron-sulfur cluster repair protein YtfE (RIC family)